MASQVNKQPGNFSNLFFFFFQSHGSKKRRQEKKRKEKKKRNISRLRDPASLHSPTVVSQAQLQSLFVQLFGRAWWNEDDNSSPPCTAGKAFPCSLFLSWQQPADVDLAALRLGVLLAAGKCFLHVVADAKDQGCKDWGGGGLEGEEG